MAEQRTRQSGPPGNDTFLALSWVPSPLTRRLLRDLQAVSGRMDIDPASIDDERIDNLMLHVYQAAAQQWRPYSALADVPQHVAPRATPHRAAMQPPLERSSQDAMSFVGMGQHFLDAPTPQYPTGMNSPSILTPSPQAPQPPHHFQRGVLQQGGMDVENQNVEQHHTGGSDRYDQPPTIAFDGHASFDTATLPPSQGSFEEMYRDLGIRETDLYDP
ncbi:hypothetical protein BU23DRAFT_565810 [Bimuria novae-zelandiae CBS 107.79]|uniref:Uncharacterized protein n=1 Tax=Bimuria novae-zelandiae CBS 107.79 TaxID=1447943 RepID=A0A6A5VHL1_9PLEO|nr:hypothetical protein BU23DRAFT_565810 [Bimuria novae-zelandiae CBS 107.79]